MGNSQYFDSGASFTKYHAIWKTTQQSSPGDSDYRWKLMRRLLNSPNGPRHFLEKMR